VVKNGRIFFSDTTFHAVPRASAEFSRTVGSVNQKLIVQE